MANTITETFAFSPLAGYSSEAGTPVGEFNPTLGTLTSVALDGAATATWSGGGTAVVNNATYEFSVAGFAIAFPVTHFGNGSSSGSTSDTETNPLLLTDFTGSGTLSTYAT